MTAHPQPDVFLDLLWQREGRDVLHGALCAAVAATGQPWLRFAYDVNLGEMFRDLLNDGRVRYARIEDGNGGHFWYVQPIITEGRGR